jgi:hypothetical protein
MKLAVFLIGYLALTGVLATLVPQGRDAAAYTSAYGRLLGEIIVQTGFSRFFTSILFFLPAFAFFANLSACTIDRLLRELRKKGRRRHGPDILHLGLMLLAIGSVVSFSSKQEGSVSLSVGDKVEMPDSRILELTGFRYEAYADGRPKDWVSTVRVLKDGHVEKESYAIRVNHPLKLGALSLYQFSHSASRALSVTDSAGVEHLLGQGKDVSDKAVAGAAGEATLFFMAADDGNGKAVVRLNSGGKTEVLRVAPGDRAGPFLVSGMKDSDITGLHAVVDPGYPLILAALLLVVAGLCLTFMQKLGDMKP